MIKYSNRLVCFLDVLGFSSYLEKNEIDNVYSEFHAFITSIKDSNVYGDISRLNLPVSMTIPNFEEFVLLSDSIILISYPIDDCIDNSIKQLNATHFIFAVLKILEYGFLHNFPLRGAINIGDVIVDKANNIFIGSTLPQLVRYEKLQKMPVCSILKSVEKTVLKLLFGPAAEASTIPRMKDFPIIRMNVPIKKSSDSSYHEQNWVINFTFFMSDVQIDKGISHLIDDKRYYFIQHIHELSTFPQALIIIPPGNGPARWGKIMRSFLDGQLQFLDQSFNPCRPPDGFKMQAVYKGMA